MTRRPYVLLAGTAVVMGLAAVLVSVAIGQGLTDPDGSLGPSYVRLPLMLLGAFVADVVPRTLWRMRGRRSGFLAEARRIVAEHWSHERIRLVVVGLVSFYVTYVAYRNLKNFVPRVNGSNHDLLLHRIDRALMFGHEPAVLLHQLLGETFSAHVLDFVYLLFLPVSPFSLVVFLVWASIRNGYWYATAQCLAWALGTVSYYALPTTGPNFAFVWLYTGLKNTSVADMQNSLYSSRMDVLWDDSSGSIQSVAGFASLHVGIILTLALLVHYTVPNVWVRRCAWVYFALTVVSTLYFGWHYIADDVAGVAIALVSVWLGGLATGHRFDRRGRLLAESEPVPAPLEQSASSAR